MSAVVLRGDARSLPLPDECVDLICTSPPYFGLRDYRDGGTSLAGQIGSERTPQEFIANLLDCTREWMRVLKPGGSLFVNLGDKYVNPSASGAHRGGGIQAANYGDHRPIAGLVPDGYRPKSLLGLPWRYALGCIDELGLILRAEIIWAKKNGLPESAADRVCRSHEQVFHFTRQPRYYAALDEIREPHAGASLARFKSGFGQAAYSAETGKRYRANSLIANPLGKLPGSVWDIPSQPLTVPAELGIDHYAAFPLALPQRIILGWSPSGICTACGEGRRPVSVVEYDRQGRTTNGPQSLARRFESPGRDVRAVRSTVITGYACACPEPTAPSRPALVLDPFAGTGTTMLAASVLGRIGVGVDRSADYCRLATWRCSDPGERARALGVPKPPPVPDGQESLFGRAGGEVA